MRALRARSGGVQNIVETAEEDIPNPKGETPPELAEEASKGLERARNDKGHYVKDDPSTPDVNEAWVEKK